MAATSRLRARPTTRLVRALAAGLPFLLLAPVAPGVVLVVLATFPVVVPFMLLDQAALAMHVSNVIALAMWRTAFGGVNDFGTGSAIAVFLFLLVIPVLALNVSRFKREA